MGAVRTNVETRLTVYIIGLTALGGLLMRSIRTHATGPALGSGLALAFVLLMFTATLAGLPRERAKRRA